MKSLQTIQKTYSVFEIITKVALIVYFVNVGFLIIGLLFGIVFYNTGAAIPSNLETLYHLTETVSFLDMSGTLLAELVLVLTDAILFTYAHKYISQELKEGTPFTEKGATMVRQLGIKVIVMTLVATIIAAVIYASFGIDATDVDNGASVILGIALILISLILSYGSELEQKNKCQGEISE